MKKHIKDEIQRRFTKGLKHANLEEITLIDPLKTDKYNVNDAESEAVRQYYLENESIDDSEMNLYQSQLPMKTYFVNPENENIDFETIKIKRDDTREIKAYKRKSPDECDD